MTDRDRLIELIKQARNDWQISTMMPAKYTFDSWTADRLLANGVIVAPMPMADWLKQELTEHVHKRCMEEL